MQIFIDKYDMREWFKKFLNRINEANIELARMGIFYSTGYIFFWVGPESIEKKEKDE